MTQNTAVAVPAFAQNMGVALPAEMRALFQEQFVPAMDSFGSGFNRISLKGMRIRLLQGGQEVRVESQGLRCVILGIAPEQFNVWYAKAFNGEEGVEPDAVWSQNEAVPENVPASALVKDANGRNQYSTRRRIVIAATNMDAQGVETVDFETLYVFDVGGMSTFGDDINIGQYGVGKAFSLSSYISTMKQSGLYPCTFLTYIMMDQSAAVPSVRFTPLVGNDNRPVMLDGNQLNTVVEKLKSVELHEAMDWRRGKVAAPQQLASPQQPAQQAQSTVGSVVGQAAVQQPVVQQQQQQQQQQQVVNTPAPQTVNTPAVQTVNTPAVQTVNTPAAQTVNTATPQAAAGQPDTNGLAAQMTQAVNAATPQAATPDVAQPQAAAPQADVASQDDLAGALNDLLNGGPGL